ncbi:MULTISPECIES: restriction endonuclease subunit S [unclassified Haloferax]|uniref:restriction endonuclease subunit S n=1 Tax=unclassified Haloferax TaxID=2625095 RepID=UPI0028754C71|nr:MULTISPECIES: restriction endonuclease subunit S [unclassified Haloferax]MDS0243405.1 restriction endonuclease subunit S [Haloferax sp. S2CR25]MDS0446526.1 restriction endonuclease subunit S [Haloferax sp. S2CR25-2]
MSEEVGLDKSADDQRGGASEDDSSGLDHEQFGPFTLSTPGDWTAKRLGDIKQLITRGKQPTYADEGVPVINQECIYWDGWHFENLRYLDADVAEGWKEKYFPERDDVILNSTGQGTLGRAQVYPDDERRAVDSHVTLLRTDDELLPHFHRYFLESHLGQALLYSMCVNGSTGQIELSKTRLDLLPVPLPPIEEQRKIASILYNLDQAIQKTNEIVDQAKHIKSGVVQQVFSEGVADHSSYTETKSGKTPSGWEIVRFDELIEDTRYGTDNKSNTDRDGYPTLRIPNVVDKRITLGDLKHTPLDDDEKERLLLEEDDILVIRTNGNPEYAGRCATFTEQDEDFVFASYLIRVRVDESRVRPAYIREFLNSQRGRTEMSGWIRSSAGNYNLSVGAMEKFQVPVPSLKEQDLIIEKIEQCEEAIEINRQHHDRLQRLKQGLMQDLLSGTVRTTDTNIAVLDEVLQHG